MFHNYPNSSLGGALLEGSNGALVVSNIGSSGQDGVQLDLMQAASCDVTFDTAGVGGLSTGAYIEGGAIGSFNGVPAHPLGSLRVTKSAGLPPSYSITADMTDISSPTQRIRVRNLGVVLADIPGHSGTVGSSSAWPIRIGTPDGQTESLFADFPPATTFVIDASIYIGDQIEVIAESPGSSIEFTSEFAIRAKDMATLTIIDELALPIPDSVTIFGFDHHSLGGASLHPLGGELIVNNIGSSGNDGVAIEWVDDELTGQCPMCPNVFNIVWDNLEANGTLADSAEITVAAYGRVDNIPDRLIGVGHAMKLGSQWQISADFSPIGNTTQKIVVLNGGVAVDSVSGHTGPAALAAGTIGDWHWSNIKSPVLASKSERIQHPEGCTGTFPSPVPITLLPSTREARTVMGDAIRMIPEDHTLESQYMNVIEIKATDIFSITISSESGEFDFICGDADGNDIVTISDAVYLINYIFAGGLAPNPVLSGDADCNGLVTISDVVYLINYIFAGGTAPCAACP